MDKVSGHEVLQAVADYLDVDRYTLEQALIRALIEVE